MNRRSTSRLARTCKPAVALLVTALTLVALTGCGATPPTATPAAAPTAPRRTTTAGLAVVEPDEAYYQFGIVLPVGSVELWRYDPHSVALYSVQMCRQGETAQLLEQLAYVESDAGQGESFARFVELFGPDLERYIDRSISLRFVGVRQNERISVWYYALLDDQGEPLDDGSWVTVHRSKLDGRCALAGVFINQFGEQSVYMPEDLITSR